jgi:hypothetical protein
VWHGTLVHSQPGVGLSRASVRLHTRPGFAEGEQQVLTPSSIRRVRQGWCADVMVSTPRPRWGLAVSFEAEGRLRDRAAPVCRLRQPGLPRDLLVPAPTAGPGTGRWPGGLLTALVPPPARPVFHAARDSRRHSLRSRILWLLRSAATDAGPRGRVSPCRP